MDVTQATQIRSLLLEAADAIDRANAIVSTARQRRPSLACHACSTRYRPPCISSCCKKLYLRYPGLAEDGEGWDGAAA